MERKTLPLSTCFSQNCFCFFKYFFRRYVRHAFPVSAFPFEAGGTRLIGLQNDMILAVRTRLHRTCRTEHRDDRNVERSADMHGSGIVRDNKACGSHESDQFRKVSLSCQGYCPSTGGLNDPVSDTPV